MRVCSRESVKNRFPSRRVHFDTLLIPETHLILIMLCRKICLTNLVNDCLPLCSVLTPFRVLVEKQSERFWTRVYCRQQRRITLGRNRSRFLVCQFILTDYHTLDLPMRWLRGKEME